MTYDCAIIGGGPAGLSAALQCKALGLSALLVASVSAHTPLAKAPRIDNYLGLPGLSGASLLESFWQHVEAQKAADIVKGLALTAMQFGGNYALSVGQEMYTARTLLLALGVAHATPYPGEEALLGKGVSYCAVCDGALYRGRQIVVVGLSQDAAQEAAMLDRLGCKVTFLANKRPATLPPHIPFIKAVKLEILGENKVTGVAVNGEVISCEGVFLLRDTVAPAALLPQLALRDGHISVDAAMATSLPGVFAAGDCVGPPLQIAKAVGEGQLAAYGVRAYLERNPQRPT